MNQGPVSVTPYGPRRTSVIISVPTPELTVGDAAEIRETAMRALPGCDVLIVEGSCAITVKDGAA